MRGFMQKISDKIYPHGHSTVKAIKQEVLTMGYHTRETNTVPCGYHELNPEMEALLAEYLEDGKRKGLQESSIHLHDKIGHYFLSALADTGCAAPQAMNAQNGQRQMVPFTHPDIPQICISGQTYRQGLQRHRSSFQEAAAVPFCLYNRRNPEN